ncbi:uncharacterized protein EI90DRAFT_3064302 [Cantharellus anzutake]|uniref:uncharacterized protein n=1 Tax=Cantharellus anzutake TaxID=1750568 RepID=UPI001905191F|nr:uncharacterized protein EI90DRAFT_3064302 [Cantharellus anzutake]KAF8328700.1 hypothetical protein EI90DRAFT_3064302 [Cantharellus anzutake]
METYPPEGSQQPRRYNRACCACRRSRDKRKCNRKWNIEGGRCSKCEKLGIDCTRQSPKLRASRNRMNAANTPARGHLMNFARPLYSGPTTRDHDRDFQRSPADNVLPDAGIDEGIQYANFHFPGIFHQERFNQRSQHDRDMNSDDHEHFSVMLFCVIRLFSKNLGEERFRELLDVAEGAYGREFETPTLATVMATILLSWLLPRRSKQHIRFAKDLLAIAREWLDSYGEREFLRSVPLFKICHLLDKVGDLVCQRITVPPVVCS